MSNYLSETQIVRVFIYPEISTIWEDGNDDDGEIDNRGNDDDSNDQVIRIYDDDNDEYTQMISMRKVIMRRSMTMRLMMRKMPMIVPAVLMLYGMLPVPAVL